MVLGIGVDIIEIHRIQESHLRVGERFLEKIFTPAEIEYCFSRATAYQHLAARFAAKEAIAKCLTNVWKTPTSWTDIEITNSESGAPSVKFLKALSDFPWDQFDLKITISHSKENAVCFAVLSQKTPL